MTTETLPQRTDQDVDDWDHVFCPCDPDVALCGVDLTGLEECPAEAALEKTCPMCVVLAEPGHVCGRCGQ